MHAYATDPRTATWPVSAAVAAAILVIAAAIVLFPPEDRAGADARAELQPGDTFVRTERIYRRYGPAADRIRERFPDVGPETQVVTLATTFDADGCVAAVTSTRATEDGEVIEESSFTPGDGTAMGEVIGDTCIEEFQAGRRDDFEQVMAATGGSVASEANGIIEVASSGPALPDGGVNLPYTGDLDVTGSSEHYFFEADTRQLVAYERRAALADGSSVVLERFEVVSEVIQ